MKKHEIPDTFRAVHKSNKDSCCSARHGTWFDLVETYPKKVWLARVYYPMGGGSSGHHDWCHEYDEDKLVDYFSDCWVMLEKG